VDTSTRRSICPEGAKRSKLNPQDHLNASPRIPIHIDELQSTETSGMREGENNDVASDQSAWLKERVEAPEQSSNFPLQGRDPVSMPIPYTSVQRTRSDQENPSCSAPVHRLESAPPSIITPELRAILEKYPQLIRYLPKHTRVGEKYQAQIPPCTKSSRFKEIRVMGSCYDIKTSLEAERSNRKTMREEMLLKKDQLEKKADDSSLPSQNDISLTSMLLTGDLDDDDSDSEFNYESAKESNAEKACRAEGIIARRLDCLPGEKRDEGRVQYLIRWEDGTTEWEYEELLGEQFADLIDDYLYKEGLITYVDSDDHETSTDNEGKISPTSLTIADTTPIFKAVENASYVDLSLQKTVPPVAVSPEISNKFKKEAFETVTTLVAPTQTADGEEEIPASNVNTNEVLT